MSGLNLDPFENLRTPPIPGSKTMGTTRWAVEKIIRERDKLKERTDELERDRILREASENRFFMAALMDNDYLGLRICVALRNKRLDAEKLADETGKDINTIVAGLVQLGASGAVVVEDTTYQITDRAKDAVEAIESKIGKF